jgi:hypothetical protein
MHFSFYLNKSQITRSSRINPTYKIQSKYSWQNRHNNKKIIMFTRQYHGKYVLLIDKITQTFNLPNRTCLFIELLFVYLYKPYSDDSASVVLSFIKNELKGMRCVVEKKKQQIYTVSFSAVLISF